MFATFFISEFKYTLKQPALYIYTIIFGLLEFFTFANDNGLADAIYRNSPFIISRQILQLSLIGLVMVIGFFNNTALRDYKNEFDEILFSTPIHKFDYFFGRFFATVLASTLPFLGAYIGFILGSWCAPFFGWINADQLGPLYTQAFINNYFIFVLPNMFVGGSIIYAIAMNWRNTIASFMGMLLMLAVFIISSTLMSDIGNQLAASLTDIFGINLYNIETRYYTAIEKTAFTPHFQEGYYGTESFGWYWEL